MSTLDFIEFTLEITDLPVRARSLDDDAASDVLGGFSRSDKMRLAKKMQQRRQKTRKARPTMGKKAMSGGKGKAPVRKGPARASRRNQFMAKAEFHSRMAGRFRRMAGG